MIDAVLSYHLDPDTCGVARFNAILAQKLGVPMLSLDRHPHITPLISVKTSECEQPHDPDFAYELRWCQDIRWYHTYDLFLHDDPGRSYDIVESARRVYYARTIGCPSTLHGNPTRGAYRVLTFGMVHKMLAPQFSQLKHRLDVEHPDYTIELSCARHEGKQEDMAQAAYALREIFGDKLRVLGYLADDALAKELQDVDAVALYYTPAVRANNTTVWAALEAGKTLYTNTDEHSPELDASAHSWEKLLEMIRA